MSDLRMSIARTIAAELGPDFDSLPATMALRLQYLRSGGQPAKYTKEQCLNAADRILEMAEVRGAFDTLAA